MKNKFNRKKRLYLPFFLILLLTQSGCKQMTPQRIQLGLTVTGLLLSTYTPVKAWGDRNKVKIKVDVEGNGKTNNFEVNINCGDVKISSIKDDLNNRVFINTANPSDKQLKDIFDLACSKKTPNIQGLETSVIKKYQGSINNVQLEHKIYQNGKEGMQIYIDLTVNSLKDVPSFVKAFFYLDSGEPIKALNQDYSTPDGSLATSKVFTPTLTSEQTNIALFLPYEELKNVPSGRHKFVIELFMIDGLKATSIIQSKSYYFSVNSANSQPTLMPWRSNIPTGLEPTPTPSLLWRSNTPTGLVPGVEANPTPSHSSLVPF
ncbi:hypothetical protein [Nostoc sp.]|uniref:hypothetical protein n=1 Tax=Nostoc sp. TaxID=1180 RepID=UPI002FF4BC39